MSGRKRRSALVSSGIAGEVSYSNLPKGPKQLVAESYNRITDRYLEWSAQQPDRDGEREHWARLLCEHLTPRSRVLDLGCGAGSFTRLLAEHFEVTGIDSSVRQIELARQNVTGVRFVHAEMIVGPAHSRGHNRGGAQNSASRDSRKEENFVTPREPSIAGAFSMLAPRCRNVVAFAVAFAALVILAPRAEAVSWTNPEYLYRYFVWGARHLGPHVTDYERFPYRSIETGSPAYHFARGSADSVPVTVELNDGGSVKQVALDELLRSTGSHAFIIVSHDQLLYEHYFNGYQRDSINFSASMAKSFTSALVGIAIDEGFIKSIDDPIINYLPELTSRGFDAITIRHLLTMGSGIKYTNRESFDFPWGDAPLAYFYPDLRKLLLSDLVILEPPGQSFHYNSYNTELLGMILERTTHRTPSEYLQEKIWKPIGMEYPATWSIDSSPNGLELMAAALNARAIDFAKFGLLYLKGGNWNGRRIVPPRWVTESTVRDQNDKRPWQTFADWHEKGAYYKYFWWGISRAGDDYDFLAIGMYGQFIFVSPRAQVVIVRTGRDFGIEPLLWPQIFHYIADRVASPNPPRDAAR
jgi:CubicO group peptidase (beta-lactamase class C family)